jgi:hypothetical protein
MGHSRVTGWIMRRIFVVGFLMVLGGCSDISSLLSFDSKPDDEPVVAQAAAPAARPAPDDTFCRDVAVQEATRNGFDEATRKRVVTQSYAQCQAFFGQH